MGSLAIGRILLSLLGLSFKATKVTRKSEHRATQGTSKAVPHMSEAVRQVVDTLKNQTIRTEPETLSRQDIGSIYEQQKRHIARHIEVPSQTPYVVAQTTVLGNYLSEQDWQELSQDKLSEAELLRRMQAQFDEEVHLRITKAAERAGFINVRSHVRSGLEQVAAFSDGVGHGIRVAISHREASQIGVDLIGYEGSACESKRLEILDALAAEGIALANVKTIRHDDPEGFKGKQAAHKRRAQRRRNRRQAQRRH